MAQSAAAARVEHTDLIVDVLDVLIGGLRGDEELRRYFANSPAVLKLR
jgi:hypothetical protein